jgi:endoglucanase
MKKRMCKRISFFIALVMILSTFVGTSTFALTGAGDLIKTHTFDDGVGLPWHVVESYPAAASFDITGGTYNIKVTNPGTNRWDVQFRHRGLTIEQGHNYTVKFTVTANKDCSVYTQIGEQNTPYTQFWNYNKNFSVLPLKANVPTTVTQEFTMTSATCKTAEWAFQLAGNLVTASDLPTFKFDNMYLLDSQFPGYPDPIPEPTNGIRLNQEGYFPNLDKVATLVSSSTSPVGWKLVNSAGATVASGMTTVKGFDKASGDNVHIIDFSSFKTIGTGYKLVADSSDASATPPQSMTFDIGTNMYTAMKYDAMKYFYHNRSGIEIKMPYCEESQWARPAGHTNDNLSPDPTKDYKANYSLNITGGWYDAGDHGKYVVNGGISTWTVMNQYERALYLGDATVAPFADKTLNIPESGNGYPDILDESRYNLECLLKMQVPAGNTLAGMVHHKAHDERWTALAVRPDQDTQPRWLQPPSTAATLNLAAIAAQGSRLWKQYDSTFATKCLTQAETAWDAAVAHPDIYAPMAQGTGGGAYGDDKVTDEFYWAACELYITTGKAKYLDYIKSSPYYLTMPTALTGGEDKGLTGCFDWGNVQGLGTISLALAPNNLPAADIATAKANIQAAADKFISIEKSQGYGMPLEESGTDTSGVVGLPWGSNSFIVNEAIVMSYAYEFSDRKSTKYLSGATTAMDYILGRNPNVQSYVTGFGENPLENPHHRFWAYQADNTFPKAPAGCLSGGPNSGLQDPWVKGSGWVVGQRPSEKCFMDNIESWSTNEITINWNAPLAWISAYLDEQGPKAGSVTPSIIYGDINNDGSTDSVDLAAIKRYILTLDGTGLNLEAGDVNADGSIDSIDLALVKQFLLGSITKFPAES